MEEVKLYRSITEVHPFAVLSLIDKYQGYKYQNIAWHKAAFVHNNHNHLDFDAKLLVVERPPLHMKIKGNFVVCFDGYRYIVFNDKFAMEVSDENDRRLAEGIDSFPRIETRTFLVKDVDTSKKFFIWIHASSFCNVNDVSDYKLQTSSGNPVTLNLQRMESIFGIEIGESDYNIILNY